MRDSRAESTSLSRSGLAGSRGKTVSSPDAVNDHDILVPYHAFHAPQQAAASLFGLLNQRNDFFHPATEADFT